MKGHNKTPKEPEGYKTRIKIRVQQLEPITPDGLMSWHEKAQSKLADTINPMTRIWANIQDINTKPKLAYVIWRNFGDGVNVVYGFDKFKKNKNYNPEFECTMPDCKFYKPTDPEIRPCTIYNKWRKGWQCKANSRIRPNWDPKAIIKIESQKQAWQHEGTLEALKYIKYEYARKPFKMRNYWFWEG